MWNTSTIDVTTNDSRDVASENIQQVNPILVFAALMCLTAALSQTVVILIARGLEGDFSARTFMWVHALARVCQQLAILYMAVSNATGNLTFNILRDGIYKIKTINLVS